MKKLIYTLFGAFVLSSCIGGQQQNETDKDSDSVAVATTVREPADAREIIGTIGDGTSMNMLELVTDSLDTLYIEMTGTQVQGGELVGDRIDIIYRKTTDGLVGTLAINMTSLQHLWTQDNGRGGTQSLELDAEGRATTYDMDHVIYDRWSLRGGRLLLHVSRLAGSENGGVTDTFDIMMLTADTLVLSNDAAQQIFWREN